MSFASQLFLPFNISLPWGCNSASNVEVKVEGANLLSESKCDEDNSSKLNLLKHGGCGFNGENQDLREQRITGLNYKSESASFIYKTNSRRRLSVNGTFDNSNELLTTAANSINSAEINDMAYHKHLGDTRTSIANSQIDCCRDEKKMSKDPISVLNKLLARDFQLNRRGSSFNMYESDRNVISSNSRHNEGSDLYYNSSPANKYNSSANNSKYNNAARRKMFELIGASETHRPDPDLTDNDISLRNLKGTLVVIDYTKKIGLASIPSISGYLYKRCDKFRVLPLRWRKRYFVLAHCHLYWFESEEVYRMMGFNAARGSFSLVLNKCVVDLDHNERRFSINFINKKRKIQMETAESSFDRGMWATSIQAHIKKGLEIRHRTGKHIPWTAIENEASRIRTESGLYGIFWRCSQQCPVNLYSIACQKPRNQSLDFNQYQGSCNSFKRRSTGGRSINEDDNFNSISCSFYRGSTI